MTEEKGRAAGLETQLQFEMTIASISTAFINMPTDRIDSEIGNAQRQICEYLDIDICAVWQQVTDNQEKVIMTHIYPPQPNLPNPEFFDAVTHYPWIWSQIRAGKKMVLSSLADLPLEATTDRKNCELFGVKSHLSLPLSIGGGLPFGVLAINVTREERNWTDKIVMQLQIMAQVFANAIQRKRSENLLHKHIQEIERLKDQLKAENIYLKDQLEHNEEQHSIIGASEHVKYILYKINQVGPTDASVLIQGETGTGKELIAKAIHKVSERKDKQFIKVNCASIPENLIESELFGHEKGAFTGAIEKRIGRFELADGGTIFLDEIGELPINLQPKLLHVLQHGEFERLGSSKTIRTDVRVIAATNKIIEDEIKKGHFRNDLYYRLNVFPITIIPLRERKADIIPLVEHYVKFYSEKLNKKIKTIPKAALKRLTEYSWPGNVRELENIIERAIITSHNNILNLDSLPKSQNNGQAQATLEENEKSHVIKTLEETGWKINGPDGAAEILKINPQTLRNRLKKLGIKRK